MALSQVTLVASSAALAVALATTTGIAPAHAAAERSHGAPMRLAPVFPVSPPFVPGAVAPQASGNTTSSNWAAYAETGGTYTSVSSSWVEPTVTCTSSGIVAFWVGLDGYGSSSVEQTGTGADCSTGMPVYFAWWETYPQNAMQEYKDAVAPGDVFDSTVTSLGSGQYELDLSDTTKGWTEHNKVAAPDALNASAEIVAEAVTEGDSISALPDFGSVHFTGSQINKAAPQGAEPIDLAGSNGTVLAHTGAIDASGNFTITYQGSTGAPDTALSGAKSVPLKLAPAHA
ncbi:G1 family glutamic endopeptidase [Actinospica robiniae]|uniref:G1 family glutamic endopeptidase n=1 Tax=Actinospica robiniae TaxID=304901 RepID=UPI00041978D8|nr:G1 family glutamic endopeptidase [Actinospica robiniae]